MNNQTLRAFSGTVGAGKKMTDKLNKDKFPLLMLFLGVVLGIKIADICLRNGWFQRPVPYSLVGTAASTAVGQEN